MENLSSSRCDRRPLCHCPQPSVSSAAKISSQKQLCCAGMPSSPSQFQLIPTAPGLEKRRLTGRKEFSTSKP